jgi:hypothetical protein
MRYNVVPYIKTNGDVEFGDFISQVFTHDMLYNKEDNEIFDEWRGKDMGNWNKYTNDDGVVLEFYPNSYTINKGEKTTLPLPHTINDFINDMYKYDIKLYWSSLILKKFNPQQFLNKNDIRKYYEDLLERMDKSHELI